MNLQRKQALKREAENFLRSGQIAQAIPAYEALLALDDHDATAWYNLGYLHRCERRFEDAVRCYRKSIAQGVDAKEEVHLNLAVIFSEHLNDFAVAATELQAAIVANPQFLLAWLNLGCLNEDAGRLDEARDAYRQALKIEPGNGRALARVAVLDMISGGEPPSVDTVQTRLQHPGTSRADVVELGFALGELLDAAGNYDDAFAAYQQANEAAKALSRHAPYDPAKSEQLVDALIEVFGQTEPGNTGPPNACPIFICGMFRSGSTLAEALLSRHSRVTAGGELEIIPGFVEHRLQPYPASLADPDNKITAQLRRDYLREISGLFPAWDYITDKRPDNFLHIGLIKNIFPEARIIHTVRNRLDNLLSIYFGNFDPSIIYSNDIADIYHWQSQYEKLMAHWKTLYPDSIFELDYDRLVADPSILQELCAFCGLEWEQACLDPPKDQQIVRTLSNWQVRRPLHGKSSGRWKNYARHLQYLPQEKVSS